MLDLRPARLRDCTRANISERHAVSPFIYSNTPMACLAFPRARSSRRCVASSLTRSVQPPNSQQRSISQAVKRVAKAAASAGLTRDVHQQVMSACTASRKIAIRGARQGGTQSRAGLPHQHTAGGTATSKYRDGGVREGVQDDAESVCDIAKVVRARCPLVSCPSHVERFIREFGKALCNIDGLDVPSREVLVAVVRSSGGTI